jgi:DNA-binding transcriptional LysR family regulator
MARAFNLNRVDLNLLKVFDLLMEERSVTKAAARSSRTQSAISHSLQKLRDLFDDELFVNQGGTMNPTTLSRELAPVIAQALSDLQGLVDRHMGFQPEESARQFRVGVTDYTGALYLPALFERFGKVAPNARLRVVPVLLYDAAELLAKLDLDCVLIGNPVVKGRHIVETILARHEMVCAVWSGNENAKNWSLDTYLALPHLQISPDGDEGGVSDMVLDGLGLKRQVSAVIPHYMVAPKLLKGTEMVAAIADGLVALLDESSEIRVLRPPFDLPDVRVSMVYVDSKQADAGHIWLRSCIRSIVDACEEKKHGLLRESPWKKP